MGHDQIGGRTMEFRLRSTGIGALLVAAACLVPLIGFGAINASALMREGTVGAVGLGVVGIAVASGRRRGRTDSARRCRTDEAAYE